MAIRPAQLGEETSETRLVFPRNALDQMLADAARARGVGPERAGGATGGTLTFDAGRDPDIAGRIERTLDSMQARLDEIKREVDAYRFPTRDDGPEWPRPRAA